ncbi:MAG: LPS export ABC transporter permease LptG [Vitreoscilla sp.]|nr:LPS export ABC transporter permease LptG [Vitreoscilla sp.]
MRTVRALLYRDLVWSIFFVSVAFLSLFFFIDFLDQLEGVGRHGMTMWHAVLAALLVVPARLYELSPISVLIGAIYAMARLAQSSEFTILRTGGLGPGRALGLLAGLGVLLAGLTFITGEYMAPWGEQQALAMKARLRGGQSFGVAGAWLKERRETPDGTHAISINVERTGADGLMQHIRIFEHDAKGRLLSRTEAATGHAMAALAGSVWQLQDVSQTLWPKADGADSSDTAVQTRHLATLDWATTLDERLVAAAVSPIDSMSTTELWRYSRHLTDQEQTAQRYQLLFWKRALYPFACIVMMALALPFAYLQARSGGVSIKVFGGIMLGISFVLLNNVVGHLGLLRDWTPWMAASVPSLLYLALSMAAFAWLVRFR